MAARRNPHSSVLEGGEAGSGLTVAGAAARRQVVDAAPPLVPSIGPRCHELRIVDERVDWRIVYRRDSDAIVIVEVFEKKTRKTPQSVIDVCKRRLAEYDA